jgi:hypothetical protein
MFPFVGNLHHFLFKIKYNKKMKGEKAKNETTKDFLNLVSFWHPKNLVTHKCGKYWTSTL